MRLLRIFKKKLKRINPNDPRLGYISFGSKNYKGVPEAYVMMGINFLYTSLDISNNLAEKYSQLGHKTMRAVSSDWEQIEVLKRYESDLEKAVNTKKRRLSKNL